MPNKSAGFYEQIFKCSMELMKASGERTDFIGICGPQGAGKSTLTKHLCSMAAEKNLKTVSISIDDFYLTRAEQIQLSERHPNNPYLQQRGYPGTHDVELGVQVLDDLKAGRPTKIPRYDKSAALGKGDRAAPSDWLEVND